MRADGIVPAIHARFSVALAPPQGEYIAFRIDGETVGWVDPTRAARLRSFSTIVGRAGSDLCLASSLSDCDARTTAVERLARSLSDEGLLSPWRDERYAVAPEFGAGTLMDIERAAARYFGIRTYAVHVNGLVRDGMDLAMWIARRSHDKAIDPGMLDNLVGGGIATGYDVVDTLCKEAWEEAGIPAEVASRARPHGRVDICRAQPQGLQRETVFVYDLMLDDDFIPANQDGEAVEHRRIPFAAAADLIAADRGDKAVTADASLVILDCLLRHGTLGGDSPQIRALSAFRRASLEPTPCGDGRGIWRREPRSPSTPP